MFDQQAEVEFANHFTWLFTPPEIGNYQIGVHAIEGRLTVRVEVPGQSPSAFMFLGPVRGRGYFSIDSATADRMVREGTNVAITLMADTDVVRFGDLYVMPLDHAEAIRDLQKGSVAIIRRG